MRPLTLALPLALLAACSSFNKEYEVIDASAKSFPDWVALPEAAATGKDAEKFRYFADHSDNAVQRLCEQGAQARATAKIAAEIAAFITHNYAEATENDGTTPQVYTQEALAKQVQTHVVGSQVAATYWEKRAYLKDKGAAEDKKEYACFAVMRIERSLLDKAVNAGISKFVQGISNAGAKEKALANLTAASPAFVNGSAGNE
ncbi:hypothetical protein FACS1894186_0910 [Alphaproteobacteria bacterium]|nr:hypothetical protein FACS1894186_0910 [Alphaproteobacteria bacterium]